MSRPNRMQWSGAEYNSWMASGATTPRLEPGIYIPRPEMDGVHLEATEVVHDRITSTDGSVAKYAFDEIIAFLKAKEAYKDFGWLHKRGIFLWGPPGSGKTMAINILCNLVVANGGIALRMYQRPDVAIRMSKQVLRMIREVHPEMLILHVIEDLDNLVPYADDNERDEEGQLAAITSLLDGEDQIDGIVHVATTNRIDKIPDVLFNRPSRFDDVIYVGAPTLEARTTFLRTMIPLKYRAEGLVEALAAVSEGLMFAHIKELVISSVIQKKDPVAVAARLLKMSQPTGANTPHDKMKEFKSTTFGVAAPTPAPSNGADAPSSTVVVSASALSPISKS